MGGPPAQVDFFISYTAADRAWAEWIAWQLEAAGYTTVLQAWDFQPGTDFVHQMQRATQEADRTIAVVSPAYFGSQFGEAEWRVAFAKDPTGEHGLLVPVRVEDCDPPGLLSTRVYLDLVGLDEAAARERLLAGLRRGERPGRPATAPAFPGGPAAEPVRPRPAPVFPGLGPAISNLAPRNPNFTGRAELLDALTQSLAAAGTVAVVAIHGLGGVGKSQLALEYCYRHAADYQLVWWVTAESPLLAAAGLAALGPRLGLPPTVEQAEQVAGVLAELGRREGWLLVFDNAEQPGDLEGLLPTGGQGQVLVTSRNPVWGRLATPLRIDVLAAEEAESFLLRRSGETDQTTAAALAEELGGLPLALEQAAAYCEQTSLGLAGYLDRYRRAHARLLDKGALEDYPATVATTWRLNVDQVATRSPAAVQLLQVVSFLAAAAIPPDLFGADPKVLPVELAQAAEDDLILDEAIGALHRYSLVTRDNYGIRLHRLVQAVVCSDLADQQPMWAERALRLVWAGFPANSDEVETWPTCQRLLPHALAVTGHADRLGVTPDQTCELLDRIGLYLWGRAQFPAAKASFERALAIAEAAMGGEHPTVAIYINNLARVLHDLGDLAGAKANLERALAIDEAAYGPNHPHTAIRINNLGVVLLEAGDLAGAKVNFERALAIHEAAHGPNDPDVARDVNNLGRVLEELGDLASAKASYERALTIDEAIYGPNHRQVAIRANNLGGVLLELGDLAGAKASYERALRIDEGAYGLNHPTVASDVNNLGEALRELGDLAGAKASYERALPIAEAALGPNHPQVARIVNNLSLVLQALGDLAGAKAGYERALTIGEAALGPNHPAVARFVNNLGLVLRELGDLAGGKANLQRAVAIAEASLDPDHPNVAIFRRNLDLVLNELGE
jgi:tetratricopeptide (TPR) repeat protein